VLHAYSHVAAAPSSVSTSKNFIKFFKNELNKLRTIETEYP